MSQLQGDLLLLAYRTAHYADTPNPRAGTKADELVEKQAKYLAETIEVLIDTRIEQAIERVRLTS